MNTYIKLPTIIREELYDRTEAQEAELCGREYEPKVIDHKSYEYVKIDGDGLILSFYEDTDGNLAIITDGYMDAVKYDITVKAFLKKMKDFITVIE